jgi:hypothetical protein
VLIDPYVTDKLRELDADLARRVPPSDGKSPALPLSPVVRLAGRALRRMGEGLESWATPTLPGASAAARPLRSREEGCEGC